MSLTKKWQRSIGFSKVDRPQSPEAGRQIYPIAIFSLLHCVLIEMAPVAEGVGRWRGKLQ